MNSPIAGLCLEIVAREKKYQIFPLTFQYVYTSLFKHFSLAAVLPTKGHVRSALHVLCMYKSRPSCAYFTEL
jgi:hypothetical protein